MLRRILVQFLCQCAVVSTVISFLPLCFGVRLGLRPSASVSLTWISVPTWLAAAGAFLILAALVARGARHQQRAAGSTAEKAG